MLVSLVLNLLCQLKMRFQDIIDDGHGTQADFLKFVRESVGRRLKKGRAENPLLAYEVGNPYTYIPT